MRKSGDMKGRLQDFQIEGGQKMIMRAPHITTAKPLTTGVQSPLQGPRHARSSRVLGVLSCYRAFVKPYDTQRDKQNI